MGKPNGKPRLSDPGGMPRLHSTGLSERLAPVFILRGGFDANAWMVAVYPIRGGGGAGGLGRPLDGLDGGRGKPRVVFEVRVEYVGLGLPEFGSVPGTKRVENFNTEDEGFGIELARRAAERLRAGERDILLNVLVLEMRRR